MNPRPDFDSTNQVQPAPAKSPDNAADILTSDSSDLTVLQEIKKGNEDAILLLYDRYSTLILSVVRHVLADLAKGEEVVEDVFLSLWRNPGAFDAMREDLRAWLITCARRRAIEFLRRDAEENSGSPAGGAQNALAGPPEAVAKITETLQEIPPPQREIFEMVYFRGMTLKEIASRTGASLEGVNSQIRAALAAVGNLMAMRPAAEGDLRDGRRNSPNGHIAQGN